MSTVNADGLYIKFGLEEAAGIKGGTYSVLGPLQVSEVKVNYTDVQSTTCTRVGANADSAGRSGSLGVQLPAGAVIERIETFVEKAFTSSGTLASATFQVGLIADDLTTVTSATGFLTASFTAAQGVFQTLGSEVTTKVGSTGAGAYVGTVLPSSGYIGVSNSTHGSNPYTDGKVTVRIFWFMPQTIG